MSVACSSVQTAKPIFKKIYQNLLWVKKYPRVIYFTHLGIQPLFWAKTNNTVLFNDNFNDFYRICMGLEAFYDSAHSSLNM